MAGIQEEKTKTAEAQEAEAFNKRRDWVKQLLNKRKVDGNEIAKARLLRVIDSSALFRGGDKKNWVTDNELEIINKKQLNDKPAYFLRNFINFLTGL